MSKYIQLPIFLFQVQKESIKKVTKDMFKFIYFCPLYDSTSMIPCVHVFFSHTQTKNLLTYFFVEKFQIDLMLKIKQNAKGKMHTVWCIFKQKKRSFQNQRNLPSITSTFYARVFHTKFFFAKTQKTFVQKGAQKSLMILTPRENPMKTFCL